MNLNDLKRMERDSQEAKKRADRLEMEAKRVANTRTAENRAIVRHSSLELTSDGKSASDRIFADVWREHAPDLLRTVEMRLLAEARHEKALCRTLNATINASIVSSDEAPESNDE